MRILIGSLLVLIIGGILAAAYIIPPSTPSPAELSRIKSNCVECHGVPFIRSVASVHAAHPDMQCSICHAGGTTARVDVNSCIPCHGIPDYDSSQAVHNAHSSTNCIVCHNSDPRLVTADNANNVLILVGLSLTGLGLVGIVLNYAVVKIRIRKKENESR